MSDTPSVPPLVEIDAADTPPETAAREVSAALLTAIERGEPFAAVVRMPEAPPRGVRLGDVTERVRTLKRLRPGLHAHCIGLAFIVTADTMQRQAKTIRSGDKLWGCPTFSTVDPDAALAWARARTTEQTSDEAGQ
ncbi:hypothetical protein [Microbacterium sp.]|uniref:hypothetical protein n=1 Tax=Microbacterium sp. TaxID=51671 RepID=UPI003C70A87B